MDSSSSLFSSGSFSLIIRGENLDFELLSKELQVSPTETGRRGEYYSKKMKYETDYWMVQEKLMAEDGPNDVAERFTERLIASPDYTKSISKQADVCLRFYLQSDYAQIYFDFSPKCHKKTS